METVQEIEESPATKGFSFTDFIESPSMKSQDVHFMRRYLAQYIKKRDHEKFIANLPESIQRRIAELKKLQIETIELDAEFHRKVYDMEKNFQKQHDEVFQKRLDIILGKLEPEGDESDATASCVKGIPNFWLTIFKYVPRLDTMIKPADELILKNLFDIKIRTESEPNLSFTLEFHFSPNEYFSNAVLEKQYFMKCAIDAADPFAFDGPEIYKARGTEIQWKEPSKNVTLEKQTVDGQEIMINTQSFFNFFDPPAMPEDTQSPLFDAVNAILSADFEIGHFIKDRVVPRAVLYFTGEIKDDMDDDESIITGSNLEMVYEPEGEKEHDSTDDAEEK